MNEKSFQIYCQIQALVREMEELLSRLLFKVRYMAHDVPIFKNDD